MQRFRLLGPLEVRAQDEEAWRAIGAPKWRSLLAVLLIHANQVVSADTLIDDLWGEAIPAKAGNLLSIYVMRLRRLIGDPDGTMLATRSPGYLLRTGDATTDVQLFETLARDGRAALASGQAEQAARHLAEALALWRGAPLADVPRSGIIEAEAERLAELRLDAAELRITAELACGGHAQVVPDLRRLLADNPLREGLWLLLMQALDGSGRHAEALDAYGQARTVISDELGVDPGTELRRLYAKLLADDADEPAWPAPAGVIIAGSVTQEAETSGPRERIATRRPAQLPAGIADFTGREDQVQHLSAYLAAPPVSDTGAVRIALVAGYGGLGKTSLALHAAHRVREYFPDGQLYVDLLGATMHPLTPSDALARCLHDLGVESQYIPADEVQRAACYRTALAGSRVLVVLDNARDAAQVRPLLPGSASCAVLITTRNRMPDLASSRLIDLHVLDDDEALTLFTKVVGDERAAQEPEATAELLYRCGGLPLAIRICAARLAGRPGWRIRTMANRLSDEQRRLDELAAGDLAVRASFEVSFASLPKPRSRRAIDPARAFCLLGLWQGPAISTAAAAALFGADTFDAADALEILVDASLLDAVAADRYKFQDLLRIYAFERAQADITEQERLAAVTRLTAWYARSADDATHASLSRPEEIAWLLDTLRQAGASDAITALLARDPAAHASLDDPQATARLLRALDALEGTMADDASSTLATRAAQASANQPDPASDAGSALPGETGRPAPVPPKIARIATRQDFSRELTAALSQAGLTPAQAASAAGISTGIASAWCSGERLPPLTPAGITALRALLATCGTITQDHILAWTDALIRAQAHRGPDQDHPDWAGLRPAAAPLSDIPGFDLCPDPLKARTAAEFVRILGEYRTWAGDPSLRDIERACGREISIATISSALRDTRLPPLRTVLAIVRGCGAPDGHQQRFATAWRKLRNPAPRPDLRAVPDAG